MKSNDIYQISPFFVYLTLTNIASFFLFFLDKILSKQSLRRIPEKSLLFITEYMPNGELFNYII